MRRSGGAPAKLLAIVAALAAPAALSLSLRGEAAQSEWSFLQARCGAQQTVWDRALQGARLEQFCAELALARANLRTRPQVARQHVDVALELMPHAAQAGLMRAYLDAAAGERRAALVLFDGIEQAYVRQAQLAPAEIEPQFHVFFWAASAQAALAEGHFENAHRRYRGTVLRLGDLPSPEQRARLLLEAATAASYASLDNRDEAGTYLERAEKEGAPLLRPVIGAATRLLRLRADFGAANTENKRESGTKQVLPALAPAAMDAALQQLESLEARVQAKARTSQADDPLSSSVILPPGEFAALRAAVFSGSDAEAEQLAWQEAAAAGCPAPALMLPKYRSSCAAATDSAAPADEVAHPDKAEEP